jgi:hypothetical protein
VPDFIQLLLEDDGYLGFELYMRCVTIEDVH